jgi:hypothetical protein
LIDRATDARFRASDDRYRRSYRASDASLPQIKEAIRIHTHPEYDSKTKQNDIALIEVQEEIR